MAGRRCCGAASSAPTRTPVRASSTWPSPCWPPSRCTTRRHGGGRTREAQRGRPRTLVSGIPAAAGSVRSAQSIGAGGELAHRPPRPPGAVWPRRSGAKPSAAPAARSGHARSWLLWLAPAVPPQPGSGRNRPPGNDRPYPASTSGGNINAFGEAPCLADVRKVCERRLLPHRQNYVGAYVFSAQVTGHLRVPATCLVAVGVYTLQPVSSNMCSRGVPC